MSSVTRLHLLSQSMLNVSCQKQKQCSPLPADSLTESPMESVGQRKPFGACSFLGVPGLSSVDVEVDDEESEIVIGIRPRSSPRPRRRSSETEEDFEPPLCGSRRVSFADAQGLSLVQVKEFDTWDVPQLPGYDISEGEGKETEEYFLSPFNFLIPLSTEELSVRVREQKVELESIELLPGTTILKGIIRVLNISFTKAVYVRTSLDTWSSHFDLLAEYIPSPSEDMMDCFSFKLTLVPPFEQQGARVDFCLRYETPVGTFWANNNNRNYVLFCHLRAKEKNERPQKKNANKKSCLKTVGQDFSTVDNISALEASSWENIATGVSKNGEKLDNMKTKQISDGQSGTSEDGQNLLVENRKNSSRRSRSKAARMARVKDFFAQRNGEANVTDGGKSPAEAKRSAEGENHSDVHSCSGGSGESAGSQCVSELLETCSKPLLDDLQDTSQALDCTSNSELVKSESISFPDAATLTGGESAADVPEKPLHSKDEAAPVESHNINKSVPTAEESSQEISTSDECTSSDAGESADSVILAAGSESLVSQNNSYTFETVVAPLYHQAFGRVGSESTSLGVWGNPGQASVSVGDLTQSYTERSETRYTASRNYKVQADVVEIQECLVAALNIPPEKYGKKMDQKDILDLEGTLQDPVEIVLPDQNCTHADEFQKTIPGDTLVDSQSANTDLVNSQIPAETLHLLGEAQEEGLTHDVASQTTVETPQADLACRQTILDETQEVMTSIETSHQSSQSISESVRDELIQQTSLREANECKCIGDDIGERLTSSTTNDISEEVLVSEGLFDLNAKHINTSASEETENTCFEIVEEENVTTPQTSPETRKGTNTIMEEDGDKVVNDSPEDETKHSADINLIGEVDECVTKAATAGNHCTHDDMFVELRDEDALRDEGGEEHQELTAALSRQEDVCLVDTTEVKNWESMVEEEETNILTDEEDSEERSLEVDNIESEDKDLELNLEDTDTTEEGAAKYVQSEGVMVPMTDGKVQDADVLEDMQISGEDDIGVFVSGEEATRTENTSRDEELVVKVQEEIHVKKAFAGIQEVEEEEQINVEEELASYLYTDNKADVDQENPKEENLEEENTDYTEEIQVEDAGGSEIGNEEERLNVKQDKVEDSLPAPVNNVQNNGAIDESAYIQAEIHPYKEEDTSDLSKHVRDENESDALEEGSWFFEDEPEGGQTGDDSASAESDSDDEVELYMHCLRAVHTGPQPKEETGFSVGKRPSISRSKLMSTPMPSISESVDEEQHLSHLQDDLEDVDMLDFQATAPSVSSGQESVNKKVSWWKETFACSNISKTLLFATLFGVFLAIAYHYDFLACFGLYLITVVWLYCQGETQPGKKAKE